MPVEKRKRIGRRTGKKSDKYIHREDFGQASPPAEVAAKPAPIGEAEIIHWDPELPGFGVRSYATGHRAYVVQYRERGRTRRRTIAEVEGIETRTARRRARKILSEVSIGLGVEDPFKVVVDSSAFRFADLVPLYLAAEERRWKESTCKTARRMIEKFFIPEFGATAVCDITREMVMNWFDGMSDRPAIANRGMPGPRAAAAHAAVDSRTVAAPALAPSGARAARHHLPASPGSARLFGRSRSPGTPAARSSRRSTADKPQPPDARRASPFFSKQILQRDIVQHRVRQHPLQPTVLVLERLQPLGLRHLQAAELGLPLVERR
jgi:hypothetical protein